MDTLLIFGQGTGLGQVRKVRIFAILSLCQTCDLDLGVCIVSDPPVYPADRRLSDAGRPY